MSNRHDERDGQSDLSNAHPPRDSRRALFYALVVVLSAGDAMLVKLGTSGFWLMEALLFPLAFVLCLAGPLGPLRTGLTMLGGMFAGWFILSPAAAFAMALVGLFVVMVNAVLVFSGALLGALARRAISPAGTGSGETTATSTRDSKTKDQD